MSANYKTAFPKTIQIVLLAALIAFSNVGNSIWAQDNINPENYFSPSVAQVFFDNALKLSQSSDVTGPQAEIALMIYQAAAILDSRADYIIPEMIKLIADKTQTDHSELMFKLLDSYVNESSDLEIAKQGLRYLLEQVNNRQQREQVLTNLSTQIGGSNPWLHSDIYTMLGLLAIEKSDTDTAYNLLIKAYNLNEYNTTAFDKLTQLMEKNIPPAVQLIQSRITLRLNPYDLNRILGFANICEENSLYDIASDSYEYSASLYKVLNPEKTIPAAIYLPWALSSYNTQRAKHKPITIAKEIRSKSIIDPILEAIAYKSAENTEQLDQIETILNLIAEYSEKTSSIKDSTTLAKLAWFYCFGAQLPIEALDLANKAYANDPNSENSASLLAYALTMNKQFDLAKSLTKTYNQNQIAELAKAKILMSDANNQEAIATLKSAIQRDPSSLEALEAKKLLTSLDSEYISEVDTGALRTALESKFNERLVPEFVPQQKAIILSLDTQGSKFLYGSDIKATVIIKNNSREPVIISDNSFIKGHIRIDAKITGDIQKNIKSLIVKKITPSEPIQPSRSVLMPLNLYTGELKDILFTHPQASIKIKFSLYFDHIQENGKLYKALATPEPVSVDIERTAVAVTPTYLQNRLNTLSIGKQGQKIKTACLFAGLLTEQQFFTKNEPMYKFAYADWMSPLLKSSLLNNLKRTEWVTMVHTIAVMEQMELDLDLTAGVAERLHDESWPVRLAALKLLSRKQDSNFPKVITWIAEHDTNKLIRDIAVLMPKNP